MNHHPLLILVLTVLCLQFQSTVVRSQERPPENRPPQGGRGPGGQQGGRGGDQVRLNPLLIALDASGDGVIDEKELANAPVALKKLDQNGDGKLTGDEIRPAGGRREEGATRTNPDELVARLMQFDKNGDGKLTKDEVPERMQGIFERGDKNKDGVLTREELKAMAESQPAEANSPGQPGREGREGERRPPGK